MHDALDQKNAKIDYPTLWEDQRMKKHLYVAWIDYQKVSDSVTHSWIMK